MEEDKKKSRKRGHIGDDEGDDKKEKKGKLSWIVDQIQRQKLK